MRQSLLMMDEPSVEVVVDQVVDAPGVDLRPVVHHCSEE